MSNELDGKRIAFLATNGFEQVELTKPWDELKAAGADLELVSPEENEIHGMHHFDKADTFPVDRQVGNARAADYDALVLPGGVGNPDLLRLSDDAKRFVREFADAGKPIAAICHGPWMLVETGVVQGKTVTSWPSLRTDIENAGGQWVDEEVHVEAGVVTSRNPDDLEAFCRETIAALS